ncbi:Nucleotidylyl transferase [Conidiobolus coronatus NRRL 28638]|uniref:tryptophan--tRNA ligase n=1 Tax=Conidiobolus coronatus (strain ATCC 28846 / CBS 209.66 / NRRL 28638) TaxID=796925 RepID=A0A137PC98_CONC2|nr:Nucleotidylyl transferase [Conidiobolus coronatus NRRL 28638]|eukprot:KXN72561.1 Nucleotidylyl transferase [Conidiobolus coronatus NRRL 28638]
MFKMPKDIYSNFLKSYNINYSPIILIAPAKLIQSLQNSQKKMSKSDPNNMSRVELLDTPESIKEKIYNALSDNIGFISFDPKTRPSVSSLVQIYSSCSDISIDQVVENYKGRSLDEFKSDLVQVLVKKIEPIQKRYYELKSNPSYVEQILKEGSQKANILAKAKLDRVMNVMGL